MSQDKSQDTLADWCEANPIIGKVLLAQWDVEGNDGLLPSDVSVSGAAKRAWKCDVADDHRWSTKSQPRTNGTGCPACAGRQVSTTNSVGSQSRHVAAMWHPTLNDDLSPDDVPAGSTKGIWLQCPAGADHVWKTTPERACVRLQGCPFCSGRRVSVTNCLSVRSPALAAQWHPTLNGELTPGDVVATAKSKVWWLCDEGHEYEASLAKRVSKGTGCPFCSGRLPSESNNLAAVHPVLAAQWHPTRNGDLVPTEVTQCSNRKAVFVCDRGHEWETQVNLRIKHVDDGVVYTSCPACVSYGFDRTRPASLYLIKHPVEDLAKVGLAQDTSARVASFESLGWDVVDVVKYDAGHDAAVDERALLDFIRPHRPDDQVFDARVRRAVGSQKGGTECVPVEAFPWVSVGQALAAAKAA